MAQKKGIMYRIHMGSDNKPDFTPNKLPGTRFQVFKDVFFNRLGAMVKLSFLSILFCLPAIVWLILMASVRQHDAAIVPYSANLGLGYPVVTDALLIGQYRTFIFEAQSYAILVPLIAIAGVGLAGTFNVMKLFGWGEGVSVVGPFFRGIKENWKSFLVIYLFAGMSAFLLIFTISAYNYMNMLSSVLRVVAMILGILQFVLMLCMTLFMSTQAVTYNLSIFRLFKNSFIFSIALGLQTLFFIVISLLPVIILLILPNSFAIFGWMIFIFLGPAFIILIWTVYSQWAYDEFVNVKIKGAQKRRGMYTKNTEEDKKAEIERLRTRNVIYGAEVVARKITSIDEGAHITPLASTYSRADLARLADERAEMQKEEVEAEQEYNAMLEEMERKRLEELENAKKNKRRHNVKKKEKTKHSEDAIGTMPVSEEAYIEPSYDDGKAKTNLFEVPTEKNGKKKKRR